MSDNKVATRQRRTVNLEAAAFMAALDTAMRRQQRCHEHGEPLLVDEPLPARNAAARVERWREPLLALLKAFLDAARPAGGLTLNAQGEPQDLPALLAAGRLNATQGECNPKLLVKLRSGKPVDERLALAALQFFRIALARPALALEHIGGVESQRLLAVKRVAAKLESLREGMPAIVLDGLRRRAEETAGYAAVMDDACYEYSGVQPFVDAQGVLRVRLSRRFTYRPLRLASFPGFLYPRTAYEWHEWTHIEHSHLRIELLDAQGQLVQVMQPPLRRRVDDDQGFYVVEIEPEALSELRPLLVTEAPGPGVRQHRVTWTESLVFNAIDRDVLVNLIPTNRMRVLFDAAAYPELQLRVGDSPGVETMPGGWRLNRTLMPREVIAVRIRLSELADADPALLSASGEWRGPGPAEAVALRRA